MKVKQLTAGLLMLALIFGLIHFVLVGAAGHTMSSSMKKSSKLITNVGLILKNVSSDQPLAPGAIVVHDKELDMNFLGSQAPSSLEQLAEIGNPQPFSNYVLQLSGVSSVYTTKMPILPGEKKALNIVIGKDEVASAFFMPVGTNDGYAFLTNITNERGVSYTAPNYDAGFEENSPLLSGFEGGQPDPSRGEENVENGTPTVPQDDVKVHPELTQTVLVIDVFDTNLPDNTVKKIDKLMDKLVLKLENRNRQTVMRQVNKTIERIQKLKSLKPTQRQHDLLDYIEYKFLLLREKLNKNA